VALHLILGVWLSARKLWVSYTRRPHGHYATRSEMHRLERKLREGIHRLADRMQPLLLHTSLMEQKLDDNVKRLGSVEKKLEKCIIMLARLLPDHREHEDADE
jgi:hypothetical protein